MHIHVPPKQTVSRGRPGFSLQDRKRMAELYASGLSFQAVAETFGCSASAVRYHLLQQGISLRPPKRTGFSSETYQEIAKLYENGQTQAEIAARFGCGIQTVAAVLHKQGIQCIKGQRKFLLRDRPLMTEMYQNGQTISAIAAHFKYSPLTVSAYLEKWGAKEIFPAAPRVAPEAQQQMPILYKNGLTLFEIAKQLGCCVETVRNHLLKSGIKLRRRGEHRSNRDG